MRKSLSFVGAAPAATTPAPALVRYLEAVTSADAAGEALIASTTCAAVLVIAVSLRPRSTVIALPATVTPSAPAAPGSLSWTVMSLPPSWPQAFEVMTTACGACAAAIEPVALV